MSECDEVGVYTGKERKRKEEEEVSANGRTRVETGMCS